MVSNTHDGGEAADGTTSTARVDTGRGSHVEKQAVAVSLHRPSAPFPARRGLRCSLAMLLVLLLSLPWYSSSFTVIVSPSITRSVDAASWANVPVKSYSATSCAVPQRRNRKTRLLDTPPEQQQQQHGGLSPLFPYFDPLVEEPPQQELQEEVQQQSKSDSSSSSSSSIIPPRKNGKSQPTTTSNEESSPSILLEENGYSVAVEKKNGIPLLNGKQQPANGDSNNNNNSQPKKANGEKKQPATSSTSRLSSLSSSSSSSSSSSPPPPSVLASASPPEVTNWTQIMNLGFADHLAAATKTKSSTNQEESSSTSSCPKKRGEGSLSTSSSSLDSSSSSTSSSTLDVTSSDDSSNTTASILVEERAVTEYDLQQIESYWDRLMPTVSYLGTEQVAKVYQALCVAYRAHIEQRRKSGEPFIIHPVEVALLLSGLKMDGETVMAGLLHDTVEDTDLTFGDIDRLFGPTVRKIVEGETKVSKLPKLAFSDYADEQAENLRQMFVAMSDDYRIIIVKLADRLHNMRTLQHMKPEKQIKISRETLDIFAPLAHRMGIWQFKSELEDTAFMYLYPQEYKRLSLSLKEHEHKYRETLDKSQEILQRQLDSDATLAQQAAKIEVQGRTKELYSLWHKMETKGEYDLENIGDVVALRVIITPKEPKKEQRLQDQYGNDFATKADFQRQDDADAEQNKTDRGVWLCYHVLGLVQHLPGFQPVPTRVKDYISFPKPNAYQSLHTALMLNGQTIEVQIRTSTMHQVAEMGMASHWAYTDGKRRQSELYNTPWLSSIKEWQNDRISSRDFVDSVRKELLGKRVFVFLRNGKILNLARGATAIDAAFQIHTEVGLSMYGAQINGKPVPLSYELQNGDVVCILTGSQGKPSTEWMRYAKSRSTRSKLRSYFRSKQKESLRQAGTILLLDYLWMHGPLIEEINFLDDDDFLTPTSLEEVQTYLPGRTQYTEVDDLVVALGKQRDRSLLHTVVSQLFNVPKKRLVAADDENRQDKLFPGSVLAAVSEREKSDKNGSAATSNRSASANKQQSQELPWYAATRAPPQSSLGSMYTVESRLFGLNVGFEYADPEHVCEHCLPVLGDEIVGTRPRKNYKAITTVHRVGCPHAQRAVNLAVANRRINSIEAFLRQNNNNDSYRSVPRVDSVSLRLNKQLHDIAHRMKRNGKVGGFNVLSNVNRDDVPVRLQWSDLDETSNSFLTEVVVYAQDRKLLLADCSEVVSEMAEIQKTQSQTTEENAKLVFLVRVNDLGQLQQLMNRLHQIHSVLSVERACGSGAELI